MANFDGSEVETIDYAKLLSADILKLSCFEITHNGISLDMNVEYMAFEQYDRRSRAQKNRLEDLMFSLAAVTSKRKAMTAIH